MNERDLDLNPHQTLTSLFKQLLKRIDGLLLLFLIFTFLLFLMFPSIPVLAFGRIGFLKNEWDARLVFAVMPLVLIAEYFWFASTARGRQGAFLLCVVLIISALIPFFKIISGR